MAEEFVKAFAFFCWFPVSLRFDREDVGCRVLLSYSSPHTSRQYSSETTNTAHTQHEGCCDISALLTHRGDKFRHFTARPFTLQTSQKKFSALTFLLSSLPKVVSCINSKFVQVNWRRGHPVDGFSRMTRKPTHLRVLIYLCFLGFLHGPTS
jgi:hypothetical protein